MAKPKVLLFDIGGVCVISPFQAILDYEKDNNIPHNYINYAIRESGPKGAWQKLERGEIKLREGFFDEFKRNLESPEHWKSYHSTFKHRTKSASSSSSASTGSDAESNHKRPLKEAAKATAVGDPTILESEKTAKSTISSQRSQPEQSRSSPSKSSSPSASTGSNAESNYDRPLKEAAKATAVGDPTSLESEKTAKSTSSNQGPRSEQLSSGSTSQTASTGSNAEFNHERPLKEAAKATAVGDPTSIESEKPATSSQTSSRKPSNTARSSSSDASTGSNAESGHKRPLKEAAKATAVGDPTSVQSEQPATSRTRIQPENPQSRSSSEASTGSNAESEHKRPLKEAAKATAVGDPTSVQSEQPATSRTSTQPTNPRSSLSSEASTGSNAESGYKRSLKEAAKATAVGDPTSLQSEKPASLTQGSSESKPPTIDAETLFWNMMKVSRTPDPYMFPALQQLRESKQYLIGALSNTVIFPDDHPYSKPFKSQEKSTTTAFTAPDATSTHGSSAPTESERDDLRSMFDVFLSSAEIGLRKPSPEIFELAIKKLGEEYGKKFGGKITADDIVFLDDIGENCKGAKKAGLRTIKVNLGKVDEAVRELERLTGMQLLEGGKKSKL